MALLPWNIHVNQEPYTMDYLFINIEIFYYQKTSLYKFLFKFFLSSIMFLNIPN